MEWWRWAPYMGNQKLEAPPEDWWLSFYHHVTWWIVFLFSILGLASNFILCPFYAVKYLWEFLSSFLFSSLFFSFPPFLSPAIHFTTLTFCIHVSVLTSTLWLHTWSPLKGSAVSIPTDSCFFSSCIYSWLEFHSSIITFCFSAALSSLLANSLFWFFIFVKCHVGLSL